MGGKTAQTQSSVAIPPEVLARYSSVNATAQQAAAQPFQQYSSDPSAFVAPVNQQQQQGIDAVNQTASSYQPYFNSATTAANDYTKQGLGYFDQAGTTIGNAGQQGLAGTQAAYAPLQQGAAQAGGLNAMAGNYYGSSYGQAQPYNQGATGLALAGAGPVNAQPIDSQIGRYLSPYLNTVLGGTLNPVLQQQGQDRSAQQGQQIMSGAGFGDRAAISNAVLSGQQNLALGQIASGILTPAYENALATAQQQQGVGLGAAQANRAALQGTSDRLAGIGQQVYGQGSGTGQNYASLGQQVYGQGAATSAQQAALAQQAYGIGAGTAQTQAEIGQGIGGLGQGYAQLMASLGQGVQGAGLQGAQAQLGAGTLQQQTSQAGLSALYNQFQQQQGYPFQVAQFLANIAEGTGALSGSTTTSTSPAMSFLSDERAKDDIEPIGKTFDGQNIIKFRYKGEKRKQIGLSAQETEGRHPEAVGLDPGTGLKTVNYDEATKGAAARGGFAAGGMPGFDLGSVLQAQQGMYAPFSSAAPGLGFVGNIAGHAGDYKLNAPEAPKYTPPSLKDAAQGMESASKLYDFGKKAYDKMDAMGGPEQQMVNAPSMSDGVGQIDNPGRGISDTLDDETNFWDLNRGGRVGKDGGGGVDEPYPLANSYVSYLGQQRQHPFSTDGLYGNPLIAQGVGGPYATMLESPNNNIKLLMADAPRPVKYEEHDPSHASYQSLSKAVAKRKKGLMPEPEEIEGQWRGGRQGLAAGGVGMTMPYSASGTGYVPEQAEPDHELKLPEPQAGGSGGGGSGLQDLASMAKIAMMFAKNGGRVGKEGGGGLFGEDVPRTGGLFPWDPTDPTNSHRPEALPRAEVDLPPDATAGATGMPKVLGGLHPAPKAEPAKAYHIPAPEAEPASLYRIPTQPTPTARPDQPDDVMANVTPRDVPAPAMQPGLGGPITASTPDLPAPGLGSQVSDGLSDAYHSLGLGGPKRDFDGPTPNSGKNSDFMSRNQDWLIPLLKGVGAATMYPGKDLVGALAYGAQQGAESYGDVQNQMAERQLTSAETGATQASAFHTLQQSAPPGFIAVPGTGPGAFQWTDGKTYHFINKADFYGTTPGQPGISSYAPRENALEMDYATGTPTIGPSAKTDQYLAKTFKGFVPGDDPVKNRSRILALNPALEGRDTQDAAIAKNVIGEPQTVDMAHRQLVQLANAINALPATGVTGRGSGFEGRQEWANLYQTARRMIGLGDDPTITNDLASGDIIKKIQAMTATTMADQTGQHSADIANVLRSVLPGGAGQVKSSNEILSSMMVQNQRQRDFGQYYNQYTGKYGLSAGVNDTFNRDMGQRYNAEQEQLSHLFAKPQGGKSLYELIQDDPSRVSKIENGYTDSRGNFHPGIGVGISRYLR